MRQDFEAPWALHETLGVRRVGGHARTVTDLEGRGRVHRVYWIAGACVVAVQVLRVPVSATAGWTQVTHWLVALLS